MSDVDDVDDVDAVDELVEQWRTRLAGGGPDVDLGVMGTSARLMRAANLFGKAVHELHATYDLEFWEYDVLATLYRAGDPAGLSGKALIRAMLLTSGAITNRIDKLASKGLVERHTDPSDRRSMLVVLTAPGRSLVEEITPAHIANEERVLGCLTRDEQETLDTLLRKFLVSIGDTSLTA